MVKVLVKIFEYIWNNRKPGSGGYVDDVKPEDASTRTASGASGEGDTGPHQSGERRGGEKQSAVVLRRSLRRRGRVLGQN